jgi:hypothetical protein
MNSASDCNPRRSLSKFGSVKCGKPQALQAWPRLIGEDNRQLSAHADLILMALSAAYIPAEIDEGVAAALLSPFLLC